jgi:tetratricopeptide (TPR) repeat protein
MTGERTTRRKGGRLAALAAAAGALAAVTLFGGVLTPSPSTEAAAAASPVEREALAELIRGFSTGDTAAFVAKLEGRIAKNRRDAAAITLLGFAYQQRARETADPGYFVKARAALRRAEALTGPSSLVLTGRASQAVSEHRFRTARALAVRAIELDPENATAYVALGDSLVNLGRYRAGFFAYDRAAELSPSVATYGRIAESRNLLGRTDAAKAAIRLALTLDTTVPEHRAWGLVKLGELSGDRRAFKEALALQPGYSHAVGGLADVAISEGRLAEAARLLRKAYALTPFPEYLTHLGETYEARGRMAEANQHYASVRTMNRKLKASGVDTDLQVAFFEADRGTNLWRALALARAAHARRPSVEADDVLAWVLYRNGRCAEARDYSIRSLRLGTEDAEQFFHRGMIERCLGNAEASRQWLRAALAANPGFSPILAPVARRYSG